MGTSATPWRQKRDPLYRGDDASRVSMPDPAADASIVRHVLFLDGAGRATPYHSTSESRAVAQRFAGNRGRVYETSVSRAARAGVGHVGRVELLRLLRGRGQGAATWPSAVEVLQARRYVEQHVEHLIDFRACADLSPDALRNLLDELYS